LYIPYPWLNGVLQRDPVRHEFFNQQVKADQLAEVLERAGLIPSRGTRMPWLLARLAVAAVTAAWLVEVAAEWLVQTAPEVMPA